MITATALPSILARPRRTDQLGEPAFSELRHASWIVNGYLLAYVVAMPLAGRLADVWGARRLFLFALVVFIVGSLLAGRGQSIDELIAGAARSRRSAAASSSRSGPRPPRTCSRAMTGRGRSGSSAR